MAFVHQFGIIDEFEKGVVYTSDDPQKYHCIMVDDELLGSWINNCSNILCYEGKNTSRISWGISNIGVTVIPPESLVSLVQMVEAKTSRLHIDEVKELIDFIDTAIRQNKYMIHFIF